MPNFIQLKNASLLILLIIMVGCSSQSGRYQHAKDSSPTRAPTPIELKDAIPRIEAKSRGGNRDYTVRGQHYKVLNHANNFTQTGVASWYGRKFHGHLTSNGEIYDMYAMSAAHKNLPLPTYLRVTNLANNKSVVVRVNDRGPFHDNRIIDLSYSAAYKIGMLKYGTANVKIEAINDPVAFNESKTFQPAKKAEEIEKSTAIANSHAVQGNTSQEQYYIQVFATKNHNVAMKKASLLSKKFKQNVITPLHGGVYRVKLGPYNESENLSPIINSLKQSGYPNAFRRKILQ